MKPKDLIKIKEKEKDSCEGCYYVYYSIDGHEGCRNAYVDDDCDDYIYIVNPEQNNQDYIKRSDVEAVIDGMIKEEKEQLGYMRNRSNYQLDVYVSNKIQSALTQLKDELDDIH